MGLNCSAKMCQGRKNSWPFPLGESWDILVMWVTWTFILESFNFFLEELSGSPVERVYMEQNSGWGWQRNKETNKKQQPENRKQTNKQNPQGLWVEDREEQNIPSMEEVLWLDGPSMEFFQGIHGHALWEGMSSDNYIRPTQDKIILQKPREDIMESDSARFINLLS